MGPGPHHSRVGHRARRLAAGVVLALGSVGASPWPAAVGLAAPKEFPVSSATTDSAARGYALGAAAAAHPQVLVVRRPYPPLVAVRVSIAGGSLRDPAGKEGLGLLCWQTALRGTTKRTRAQQAEALEALGAHLDVATDKFTTTLSGDVLLEHLPAYLELLADVLLRPRFDPKEFDAGRAQLLAELTSARDDDDWLASDAIGRYLYRGSALGRPTTGTPISLAGLRAADCAALHVASVVQGQVRIGLAGPLDLPQAEQLVSTHIGPLPKGKAFAAAPEPPAPDGRRLLLLDKPKRTQAQVQLAVQTAGVKDSDFVPLVVANAMLGGAFTSRLVNQIREQRGWSYGVSSSLVGSATQSAWTIQFAPGNAVAPKAIDLAVQIAQELRQHGLTAKELQFAKDFLVGSQQLALESAERELVQRMRALELGLPASDLDRFAERVRAVTLADVQRALKRHLAPEHLVAVVVGSAAALREPLAAGSAGFAVDVLAPDGLPERTTQPGRLPGQAAPVPETEAEPAPPPEAGTDVDEDAELPEDANDDPEAP